MLIGDVRAEGVIRALDAGVRESLSSEQESAIRAAVRQDSWGSHPVDIRLNLPPFLGGAYVTLIAGREKRSGPRQRVERARYPLAGPANLAVLAGFAVTIFLAAVGATSLLG